MLASTMLMSTHGLLGLKDALENCMLLRVGIQGWSLSRRPREGIWLDRVGSFKLNFGMRKKNRD